MKEKEKKVITVLILLVVILVLIGIVKKSNNNEVSGVNTGVNTGTHVSVKDNIEADTTMPEEDYVDVTEDGTKINVNTKMTETKVFGNYEVSKVQLTQVGSETQLLAEVKNIGNEKLEETLVKIKLLDKQGKEMVTIDGLVGTIEAGEETQLNASITEDVVDAYDFEIEIVK